MMRLGETYLLLAEAQFQQGNTSGAAASINVLRTRARACAGNEQPDRPEFYSG